MIVLLILGVGVGALGSWIVFRRLLRLRELRARHAERRVAKSERLAVMGTMTAGLAHEIKNPLSTLVLNAQLLREEVLDAAMPDEERDRAVRRIDALVRETGRLKDILEDFLTLAGRVRPDPQLQDLREIAHDLLNFFEPQCTKSGVLLRQDLPATSVMGSVDQRLVKQAILNLLLNGLQAIPPRGAAGQAIPPQGEQEQAPPQGELILRLDQPSAEWACFHVIDTGPGIPAANLETIFRPYITTKRGGTGLGLAVARRNIEEHGGRIEVHSELGKGSDFQVHLPLTHRSAAATPTATSLSP